MTQPRPAQRSSVRAPRELARELKRLGPGLPFLLRLRGLGACKTPDHRCAFHLLRAGRFLRKRDAARAEEELRAALAEPGASRSKFDPDAVRAVLAQVRRSILLPEYEKAIAAATTEGRPEGVLSELRRARHLAEEMGDEEEVRWVDGMIEGPKLQTQSPAGSGPGLLSDRSAQGREGTPVRPGDRAGTGREGQRAQFRRVAKDSRAYAAKRLRPKG